MGELYQIFQLVSTVFIHFYGITKLKLVKTRNEFMTAGESSASKIWRDVMATSMTATTINMLTVPFDIMSLFIELW
jgi:hypothetical protein